MTPAERLLSDYDTAISGDAWYSDSVWALLTTITPEIAAFRAAPGAHSIWELVEHMMYWENVARRRMSEPTAASEELNFPAMPDPTVENWQALLQRFRDSNRLYREALLRLDAAELDNPTPGATKSFHQLAQGIIQHHVYHAGQIAMLKRLHASASSARL